MKLYITVRVLLVTSFRLYPTLRLEINSTNAGLLIHNVTLEDQGIYKCTAVLNESETVDLRLEVTNGTNISRFFVHQNVCDVKGVTNVHSAIKVYFLSVS